MIREFLRRISASRWLSGPAIELYPDSYGKTEPLVIDSMIRFARQRVSGGERIVLAAWFADEFERLEKRLVDEEIPFGIGPPLIGMPDLIENQILLCMAESLCSLEKSKPETAWHRAIELKGQLNIMVLQRHPMPKQDEKIVAAMSALPMRIRVGHFLSLDNPLLDVGVPKLMVQVLEQMGIDDHGLVSSQMLAKRVEATKRRVGRVVDQPIPADSIEEWLANNLPPPRSP